MLKAFLIIFKINPIIFSFLTVLKIVKGALPLLSIIILQRLINSVQFYFEDQVELMNIIFLLFMQIGLTIFINVLTKIDEYLRAVIQLNIELDIKTKISRKMTSVNYERLEDHEFYNLIQRTNGDLGSQFLGPINNLLEIVRSLITIISILFFLLQFHILFVIILVTFSIPLLFIQNKLGSDRYWLAKYMTPFAREQNYIFSLFIDRKYNKEIRVNQSFNYLFNKWTYSFNKNRGEVLKQELSQSKKLLSLELLSSVTFAASFFLIISLLSQSKLRIGDFVSIMEAIQRVLSSISSLSYMTSNLKEGTHYINDIFLILNIPEKAVRKGSFNNKKPPDNVIEVRNLSFKYPFENSNAIMDISLKIRKGSSVMIVGSNGSGKSTLIKCLIGLYQVPEDTINLFGNDITQLSEEEIYDKISVIYQDFGMYELTAFQNILIGDTKKEKSKVIQSAIEADIHDYISTLSEGYDTKLGRIFEGSRDLSGGQWQKLALARSIIKDSDLIILDEPSSSLDPIAEKKLFMNFKSITEGKTSIYISHRMYACHLADHIIVLKDGKIVEQGNHSELLKIDGHYTELYNNQSDMYKEKMRR
ncbi:ABC transporter ATP-binding protein [Virgibacillus salinus]|nr:ABC transporter ATP-binding protein [Virgibacillus salinus]